MPKLRTTPAPLARPAKFSRFGKRRLMSLMLKLVIFIGSAIVSGPFRSNGTPVQKFIAAAKQLTLVCLIELKLTGTRDMGSNVRCRSLNRLQRPFLIIYNRAIL